MNDTSQIVHCKSNVAVGFYKIYMSEGGTSMNIYGIHEVGFYDSLIPLNTKC